MGTLSASLVRRLVLPLWMKRDHPRCGAYLREFERTQYLGAEDLRALQWRRLRRLLAHAYGNCTFYRRRMDEAGLHPDRMSSPDDLRAMPVLTKRDIQEHGAGLCAANFPPARRVRNQTGGSTGSPLQFYVDRERLDSRMASTIRHDAWAGLRPGDWHAELWGARLDQHLGARRWDGLRNRLVYRTIGLNTSAFSDESWPGYLAELRRRRPRVLLAYAQSAVRLAQYVNDRGINDVRFESIISTAEVLLPGQRELIEQAFRGRVFNRYGCREVSVIASECERHRGMHVNAEALWVEVVPDALTPAGAGRLVVTDLLNLGMPLIRYEIGDLGAWSADACPCGRGLPLLARVEGRVTDFLTLPDGRMVSGPALTLVVADLHDVRQVQFVQTAPAEVRLRVVPGADFGEHTRAELRRRLAYYLDSSTRLEFEEVDRIAQEASGKYRFVINRVRPASSELAGAAIAGERPS
ncbi:MAG TPA: hypothetical protein VLX90_06875 [Steroidobacteraceae bacterium]|nr:hypothetical protein [Steroidobacteraceae bacterium]